MLSVVKYNIITKNCQNNEKTEALLILTLPKILQGEKMKKLLIVFLVLFFVFTTLYAKDTKQKQSSVEKSFKNQNQTTEIYKGSGYTLTLNYEEVKGNFDFSNFIGNFIIENKTDRKKFNIEGKKCTL